MRELEERVAGLEAKLANLAILGALVENSQDQLVYLDRDFNYLHVNRAYAEMLLKTPEDFVGHKHFEFYPHAEDQAIFERVRDTGEPAVCREKPFLLPHQPERGAMYCDWTLTPMKDAAGLVVGFVFSLHDVTEKVVARQRLQESEERYHALFTSVPEGFTLSRAIYDDRGKLRDFLVLDANPSAERINGLEREAFVGKMWRELWPGAEQYWWDICNKVMVTGDDVCYENYARVHDRWYELHLFRVGVGLMGTFFVDISERKRAEAERERAEKELVGLKDRLASDLAAMTKLYEISMRFGRESDLQPLLGQILTTAIEIGGAGMGIIQLLDTESGRLRVVLYRGFEGALPDFFNQVEENLAGCGGAVQRAERILFEDVSQSPAFAGTAALEIMLAAGVRAAQFTPLHARSGRLVGVLSTYRRSPGRPEERDLRLLDLLARQLADLIERSQAEEALRESETRCRSVFENMLDGYALCRMIFDEHGRPSDFVYIDVNEAFTRLTGLNNVTGKKVTEVIAGIWDLEPELLETYGRVASSRRPERFEINFKPLGIWLLVSVYSPMPGHFVSIFDNITERKRAEVERELLVEALREADRRKNEFISVLSHELRNPLTPIKNSLYILQRASPGGEQAHRARAVIARQVDHMIRLVDDLLDVTRITRGKIHLQRKHIDLNEIVQRATEDYRSLFAQNGVALEVNVVKHPLYAEVDPVRIAQVVGNLLQNAAKFTPRGGRTTLTLEPTGNGRATLRVRDTGVGIAPEILAHVFEPFMQEDQTLDRNRGGLGLGLALVKGLVELHGGTVIARSEGFGLGAELTVELPLGTQPAPHHPELRLLTNAARTTRRVLVLEDNADAADSLREVLEFAGHEVAVAYNGPEGLAKAREFRPDVVLCDIGLPGMNGYDVARAFRADAVLRETTLVALSGYALPEDVQRATEAGFERHLAKPPSLEELYELLSTGRGKGRNPSTP